MLGISIRAESKHGVSGVNDKVDVMSFFSTNILTELQDKDHSVRPMVKATAIKFASTFRNQFTKEHIAALMPFLIQHLSSDSVVVHTYSAAAIEKFLVCKVDGKQAKFGGEDLRPFLEPLFTGLFTIVENADWNENEYVMKCIMRSMSSASEDIVPITQIILEKLTTALFVVAKNPRNPQYNHYLFECIALLVKSVCAKHPEHVAAFEGMLFPPFQQVLQMDVAEFTPYVFQILAQLLEYRPQNSGLGESYGALLSPLLMPNVWSRKGNIPALTRLLQAYVMKGSTEIVSIAKVPAILGIFQKLVASKATEISAFDLLGSITRYISPESLEPMMKEIFRILLVRLQKGKTPRYVRLVTGYFGQYLGQFGSAKFIELLDSIQHNLHLMILAQVWLPRLTTDPPVRSEAKMQVVGLTKIVCETPSLLADPNSQQIWLQALIAVVKIITSQESYLDSAAHNNGDDQEEAEISYDPTFSRLHFAARPVFDPFNQIRNPAKAFADALGQARASNGAAVQQLMQQGQTTDPKTFAKFEAMMSKF